MKSPTGLTKITSLILFTAALLSFNCKGSNNSDKSKDSAKVAVNTNAELVNFFTAKDFEQIFPQHDPFYTYMAFIRAFKQLSDVKIKVVRRATSVYKITRTEKSTGRSVVVRQDEDWNEDWAKKKPDSTYEIDFGNFCNEKDSATNKKELAAFFANIAHETRHGQNGKYDDGLMLIHESNTSLTYIADNDNYPPAPGKKYYGRGPVQLSYNGNYGYASDCIFGDKKVLLDNPEMVENDPIVAFKTAIYFWMAPQTAKPSAHDVMTGKWQPSAADKAKGRTPGFGMTINIINGAVECNKGDGMFSMNDRIGFYQYMLKKLNVTDPNCACSCAKMQPYQ